MKIKNNQTNKSIKQTNKIRYKRHKTYCIFPFWTCGNLRTHFLLGGELGYAAEVLFSAAR